MRPLHAVLALALLAAAAHTIEAAQQGTHTPSQVAMFLGKRVVEIHLLVEGRPTDDTGLLDLIETRVGEPLSMVAVRESITHLFSLGRFQDIQVGAFDQAGGVQLRYDLVPLHNVAAVEYHGTVGIGAGIVRKRVSDRFGPLPPAGRAPDVARTLEQQIYPDYGYLRAKVLWRTIVEHDPDGTRLLFDIDAGPRARIGSVNISGDPLAPVPAFQVSMGAVPGSPYEPIEIRQRLDDYLRKLKKKGRYEATGTVVPRPSEDGTIVDLSIDVLPGPVVGVAFEGDPLAKLKVSELVPLEREGLADEDFIEDSAQRITTALRLQGHSKAAVTVARREGEGTLTIVFTVRKGLIYRVADAGVQVAGNATVPNEQIRALLTKLQPGDLFIEANLGAAVSAITGTYQRLGFGKVKVESSVADTVGGAAGQGRVGPAIAIVEGVRTVVGDVAFTGAQKLPVEQLRGIVGSAPERPHAGAQALSDRDRLLLEYQNAGFVSAEVRITEALSPDGTRADLTFHISEGPQTMVDHIIIVGNTRTDQRVIERELLLAPGSPLGLEDVLESQQRLRALGLFRRVRITALAHGPEERRDVLVTVEEAASTTTSYGGGLEAGKRLRATGPQGEAQEHIEFAPRGFFDVGRRNLAGKNRSINFYSRVSLRPQASTADAGTDPAGTDQGFGFVEYRVGTTYREPRAFGTTADFTITGGVEQGVRSSFNFARKGVTAEIIQRLSPGVRVSGRYSFGTTRTFDEQLSEADQATIDRGFPQVRLSAFAGAISRDSRDDVIDPTRGAFLSAEGSVAARALGGQVGFLKSYNQALWFHQLPGARRVVFATRAAVGLAKGFPRLVTTTDENGNQTTEVSEDLPASERFYAGGGTTIRGFALDTVGAPNTISSTGFPKGGNVVLIMNGEIRVPLVKGIGAAFFVDGGNVFERASQFDFGELRGSVGFGVSYKSPIGPIRIDVAFKADRREIGGRLEPRSAFHFNVGQVF